MSKSRPRYDETHKNEDRGLNIQERVVEAVYGPFDPPHDFTKAPPVDSRTSKRTEDVMKQYEKKSPLASHFLSGAEPVFTPAILADLERKLAAMVDERLASLERRVDLLYRYTVGDRAGRHMLVPNMNQRGEEFPE